MSSEEQSRPAPRREGDEGRPAAPRDERSGPRDERSGPRDDRGGPPRGRGRFGGGGGGPRGRGGGRRRRQCIFCVDKIEKVDYKDIGRLRTVITERGKIEPRRKTGCPANIQRQVTTAVKRARHMALLPYTIHQAHESGIFQIRG